MTFQQYLTISSKEITQEVTKQLGSWSNDANKKTASHLTEIFRHFEESVFGGKCLRGTLVKLGYQVSGGKNFPRVFPIAAAMEILHTSLLIHDDIIDKSPLRRGKASLYTLLGNDQAMLVGDIGFFLATNSITKSNIQLDMKGRIQTLFAEMALDTVLGEMLDVAFSEKKTLSSEKDILLIAKLKTARYTVVNPLILGATIAQASDMQLKNLEKFGETLGIAFQLQDDILGVFGDEKIVGKSITSDIAEGKQTLLFLYALEHTTPQQKEFLLNNYGAGNVPQKIFIKIKDIFEQTGALTYMRKKIQDITMLAAQYIPLITKDIQTQSLLYEMLTFLTQ